MTTWTAFRPHPHWAATRHDGVAWLIACCVYRTIVTTGFACPNFLLRFSRRVQCGWGLSRNSFQPARGPKIIRSQKIRITHKDSNTLFSFFFEILTP